MEIGERSFKVERNIDPVSSTCVVFAKSEALKLLRGGMAVNEVLAAYNQAMAIRIVEVLERIGLEREFAITGGQAKNIGLVRRLTELLKTTAVDSGELDPQVAGAIGAALFAKAIIEKSRQSSK